MNIGREISIAPIKFENHNKSCDKLEELIYEFNDLMYFYCGKVITYDAKQDILKAIEVIGTKIKDIDCNEKAEPRRHELLTNMRQVYRSVREYDVKHLSKDDVEQMQKLVNYSVALSIKAKQAGNDAILKQLEANKKVWNIYVNPFMKGKFGVTLGVSNLVKIQKELLQVIGKQFDLEYGE